MRQKINSDNLIILSCNVVMCIHLRMIMFNDVIILGRITNRKKQEKKFLKPKKKAGDRN